jgi:galactitol-specific phosphotransferase system IIB component
MKPEIREYLKNEGYIMHFWHKDDIRDKAEGMDIELTEDQIDDIAESLEKVDCNYGINWDTIKDNILNQIGE